MNNAVTHVTFGHVHDGLTRNQAWQSTAQDISWKLDQLQKLKAFVFN